MCYKYSVLMSVYYKENPIYLDISLESMMNQSVKPSEFILVEDGKLTPELYTIISKYKKLYSGIFKTIELEHNVGLGLALKIGVENCSYEYIARMDSDDFSLPNRIERELAVLKEKPEIGLIGTNVIEFSGSIDNAISKVVLPEEDKDIVEFSKRRNPFRHPSIMFKKSEAVKAGNYRDYYLCEDYDMWLRMIRNGCKCYNIQEPYVYMRISEDFYKRRGGYKYYKSIRKFKKEQLDNGYFSIIDYVESIVPHMVVCFMPNCCRDFVYKKLLRKKVK